MGQPALLSFLRHSFIFWKLLRGSAFSVGLACPKEAVPPLQQLGQAAFLRDPSVAQRLGILSPRRNFSRQFSLLGNLSGESRDPQSLSTLGNSFIGNAMPCYRAHWTLPHQALGLLTPTQALTLQEPSAGPLRSLPGP